MKKEDLVKASGGKDLSRFPKSKDDQQQGQGKLMFFNDSGYRSHTSGQVLCLGATGQHESDSMFYHLVSFHFFLRKRNNLELLGYGSGVESGRSWGREKKWSKYVVQNPFFEIIM